MSELSLKSAKSLYVNLGMTIRDLEIATDNIIKAVDKLKGMNVTNPLIYKIPQNGVIFEC